MTKRTSAALALVVVASLASLAACHRPPSESEEFHSAFQLYNQLYTASLDDAYADPRMLRVQELLHKVDPASGQAQEAKDLLEKVEKGIAEASARAARVAADQKAAEAPGKMDHPAFAEPARPAAPAGPPASGPALGMTRDEFVGKFGDCFERKGDYEQGPKRGEAFALLPACKEKYPAMVESLVVLLDNRVASLVPLKEVTVRTVDAGGPPVAAPPPAPVPAPPPPPPARFMPGMPVPQAPGAPGTNAPPANPCATSTPRWG